TLTCEGELLPTGETHFHIGAIDQAARLQPTKHIFPEERLPWLHLIMPRDGVIRVRAGTLDDTSWLRPTRHIWTRSKQPWITLPQGDEIFEVSDPRH
ncbi:MAG TPA: hypothetical protein VGI68_13220, partial [Mycobacterium sp.]